MYHYKVVLKRVIDELQDKGKRYREMVKRLEEIYEAENFEIFSQASGITATSFEEAKEQINEYVETLKVRRVVFT